MSDAKEPVDDMEMEASGDSDNSMDNSRQSKSGGLNKENSSEDDEEMPSTHEGGSIPERLRQRKGKKPSYAEDLDDYMDWESDEAKDDAEQQLSTKKKKKQRAESCSECGEGDKLIYCSTCSAAYHLACLNPPLKVAPRGRWSCPQCVDPLAEIEKFLDCEVRAKTSSGLYSGVEVEAGSSSEQTKHYLVKWKSRSYLHCSWIPEADLERAIKAYSGLKMKYNNFRRQIDSVKGAKAMEDEWVPIRSEWTTVEKVLDFRQTVNVKEYLVKWKELGYEDISWEVEEDIATFQAHIDRFNKTRTRRAITPKKRKGSLNDNREAQKKRKEFKAFEATPKFLSGGVLHAYQLEGLNFLRFAWQQGKHVILADEMGLGKTIQSISFLASLMDEGLPPPHLVVAPLSTLRNWEREFSTWAPQMNTVMYVGSAQARATIRELEFYLPKEKPPQKKKKQKKKPVPVKQSKQDRIKFDVLLTSYEMINFDTSVLKSIKWECLIVDEGHRLKNKDSKLFQTLQQYTTRHRVLLTGTPLQNNLDELFMLMHFLDAGKFASLEEFQQEFKDLNQEEQVGRLHKMLAPHLLRRVKKDVMKDLPPKKELILRVELSALQKEYYKAILTRNYQILARQGGPQISLNNVVMELRKLCGHPYLLEGVEEELRTGQDPNRQLIEASGKLLLMDKMMAKLKAEGHRVLIYSQFKVMLDILEDWMSFKQWSYERIDGNISGAERQIRIDRFNAPNSKRFCFLLSTRAGGLGINLATADTVIIYDSDWNPHADLQAMARAHRLGQTKKVMIYRLVTRGTIEERMMQMTKKKMVLEHLVVGRLKNQQVLNQEELDDILRYGAKELFADENDETKKSQQIHYDDAAIDRLLDRSQVKAEEAASDEEDDDLLKAFKVANFEYVDEEDAKDAEGNQDANGLDSEAKAKYWDDLLKQRFEEQKQRDAAAELGKGKRARKQVLLAEDDLAGMASVSSDDEDDEALAEGIGTEANAASKEALDGAEKKTPLSKKKPKVDSSEPPGPPPLMQGDGKSLKILGFSRKHRAAFVQILMRFGIGDFSWSEFIPRMRPKSPEQIKQYGTLFLTHIAEDISDLPTFSDGVPKEGLRIQDVLVRLAILHLIQDKVKNIIEGSTKRLFSDDVYKRIPGLMNVRVWKEAQDWKLLQGILKHGYGRWQEIIDDGVLDLKVPACKELQLPVPPVSALDGAKSPNKQSPQENTAISNQDNATSLDPSQGGGQDDTGTLSADKQEEQRVHKRMVEFLKKRISLLEKALNAEYHQESMEEQKVEEDNEIAGNVVVTPEVADSVQPEHPRTDPSTLIPLAPEEIAAHAYDMDPRRLEVARIYNEICKLVNASEVDASEAYAGNKSAGIRLRKTTRQIDGLCIDMRKAFMVLQPPGTVPGERGFGVSFLGEDADVLSDENDEELDVEMDSDCEARNAAGGSHRFEAVNHQERPPDKVSPMHSNNTGWKNSQVTSVTGTKDASGRTAISTSVIGSKDVPGASGISMSPIGSKVVAGASTMSNSQGSNTTPRWSPAVVVLDD